jgi:hypothetical protein
MRQAPSLEYPSHGPLVDPSKRHKHHSFGVSPTASVLSRPEREHVLQPARTGAWWAEVEDVRARIERRRAIERAARQRTGLPPRRVVARRTVTITGRSSLPAAEMPVRVVEREAAAAATAAAGSDPSGAGASAPAETRRRPRRTGAEWLGEHPDRIAAWAAALGFLLVLAAIISSH